LVKGCEARERLGKTKWRKVEIKEIKVLEIRFNVWKIILELKLVYTVSCLMEAVRESMGNLGLSA